MQVFAIAALFVAAPAFAAIPADLEGSGAIIGAVNWLQGTLLGTVATVIADDLLIALLRMRPDRIILGEIRGKKR